MKPKVAAAIITGTMASPSRPSVRFTALPAPTMMKAPKRMKNQPRLMSVPLKKGMVSEVASGSCSLHDRGGGGQRGDGFDQDLDASARTFRRLPGDFQVVVVEADGAIDQCEQQHHPDEHIFQIAPQQRGDGDAGQDHQPAHGRRALLLDEVRSGPSLRMGWPLPWRMRSERIMRARTETRTAGP